MGKRGPVVGHSRETKGDWDSTCFQPGCDREPKAKGFCRSHYVTFKRFGLPLEDFLQLQQVTACMICGAIPPAGLVIDHDHRCCPRDSGCAKCIRGRICHPCNRGIGLLADDPVRLRAAIEYLEKPR